MNKALAMSVDCKEGSPEEIAVSILAEIVQLRCSTGLSVEEIGRRYE